jgi:hypothetical protein
MPQLLEHIVATLGLSYMKFAGMESRETQIKNAKNYPRKRVSQRAQLESRLWPCRHSKIQKLLRNHLCFGARHDETTVVKRMEIYVQDPQEKGSRTGTRFYSSEMLGGDGVDFLRVVAFWSIRSSVLGR